MNYDHKILQKNVYRIFAGNCDEIASVVSLHRNDNFRIVIANVVWRSNNKLSWREGFSLVAILAFVITSVAK